MKIVRLVVLVLSFVILAAWPNPLWARQSRLSAAVAIVSKGPGIEQFLQKPGGSYVQAYARFRSDMPDDVIMALDQEFLEGVSNPLYVSGGDWMAFVGIQRSGAVWIAAGTAATMIGVPSKARNWQIMNLGTRLHGTGRRASRRLPKQLAPPRHSPSRDYLWCPPDAYERRNAHPAQRQRGRR